MKKTVFAVLVLVASLTALARPIAAAQNAGAYGTLQQKPALTGPVYTAMLFHKLSGQAPDFEAWARQTPEYKAAPNADTLRAQLQLLKNTFSLLTFQDPLVVEMPVRLSIYNAANQGFLVQNFRDDSFFPIRYNGQSYAVVPLGIMDRQWMKVTDAAAAQKIDTANADTPLTAVLMLEPKYADKSAPVVIEGESHWLISTEVKKIMLFAPQSTAPLWQSGDTRADDLKFRELMKLRPQQ